MAVQAGRRAQEVVDRWDQEVEEMDGWVPGIGSLRPQTMAADA